VRGRRWLEGIASADVPLAKVLSLPGERRFWASVGQAGPLADRDWRSSIRRPGELAVAWPVSWSKLATWTLPSRETQPV
jgi:hypothetical protein